MNVPPPEEDQKVKNKLIKKNSEGAFHNYEEDDHHHNNIRNQVLELPPLPSNPNGNVETTDDVAKSSEFLPLSHSNKLVPPSPVIKIEVITIIIMLFSDNCNDFNLLYN